MGTYFKKEQTLVTPLVHQPHSYLNNDMDGDQMVFTLFAFNDFLVYIMRSGQSNKCLEVILIPSH